MQLITPDLEDFMDPMDVSGHVFSPNNFRDETLKWIENRNNKSGCRIPCLMETDLRIIPGTHFPESLDQSSVSLWSSTQRMILSASFSKLLSNQY